MKRMIAAGVLVQIALKERGKAAGVEGWIVEPFKGAAVLETFKKLAA